MGSWDGGRLTPDQRRVVERLTARPQLLEDLSWGTVDTVVLRVGTDDGDRLVKAGGAGNHHIGREIDAHENWLVPLRADGRAARLIGADRQANVFVAEFQPGVLVQGSPAEFSPDLHRQAGEVLRLLHDQEACPDTDYERRVTAKALAWLDRDHRIRPEAEVAARRVLEGYTPEPVVLVPTHGDWQPRNWLAEDDRLRVIDFGRFDHRPAATDLCRLAAQQWRDVPSLEDAFLDGYGGDPRVQRVWLLDRLREAVGTAAWAHQVGEDAFEAQGHRMIEEALAPFA